jgi:hypothetical protein
MASAQWPDAASLTARSAAAGGLGAPSALDCAAEGKTAQSQNDKAAIAIPQRGMQKIIE